MTIQLFLTIIAAAVFIKALFNALPEPKRACRYCREIGKSRRRGERYAVWSDRRHA